MFHFAAPEEIIKAMKIYSGSFYGSSLWDLSSEKAGQVFTAWNTSVKLVWGCPKWTRSYFLQELLSCGYTSAKADILGRFVGFFHSLRQSASFEAQVLSRMLSRDVRSVTGKNLQMVQELTNLNPWTTQKKHLKIGLVTSEIMETPLQDRWRIQYLSSLLSQRRFAHLEGLEEYEKHLSELIESLVMN